jgi:hypothetical protein
MNRTGLLIALSVAAAVGLLFGLYPRLDLRLAELFYDPRVVGSWLGNLRPCSGRAGSARGWSR